MYRFKKKIWLTAALLLTLTACGGGGGGGGGGGSNSNEATLSNDVVIQEDLSNIESIKSSDSITGEILFNSTDIPKSWSVDKIILFPPSDAIDSGVALKITSISEANGKTKVSYTTPSIDELFVSVNSEETAQLSPRMFRSFSSPSGVKMSVNIQRNNNSTYKPKLKTKIDNSELVWFPSFGKFIGDIQGDSDSYVESLNFALDKVVIVRTKDKTQEITLSGGIKLRDLKIHHKFILDSNLLGLPDLDTLEFGAQIDYTLDTSVKVEAKVDLIEANMAELPGIKNEFSCASGNNISYDKGDLEIELTGANWPKTDVCLGAVSINLAGISVKSGNGGLINLNPSVDLYLIMGMDLELSLKASWSFKKTTDRKLGLWVDKTKSDEQLTYVNSSNEISKENIIQGSIDGSLRFDEGVALALNIMNIKPAVVRGYLTLNLDGKAKVIYSNIDTENPLICLQGEFTVGPAASFHAGVSTKFEIKSSTWLKGKSFGAGVTYDREIEGDILTKFDYDSCKTTNLDINTSVNSLNISAFTDSEGQTKDIKGNSIAWEIYTAAPFVLINTFTTDSVDINDLEGGDYVAVLTLLDENGVEFIQTQEFSVPASSPTNLAAIAGNTIVTLNWSSNETNHRVHYAATSFDGLDVVNYSVLSGYSSVDIVTGTSAVVTNLANDTKYYFVVTALKDGSESDASNEVSASISDITNIKKTLNDTGITSCGDYAYTDSGTSYDITGSGTHNNNLDCSVQATVPTQTTDGYDSDGDIIRAGQDALYGRDVTHNDDRDGHAGFSFSKLDSNGNALAASTSSWSCVKDNVTGLTWEVKTTSGLQNASSTYSWYNTDTSNNGGYAGRANGGSCSGGSGCDTQKYASDVNSGGGLCGATDWRLPTKHELNSIVKNSTTNPAIDAIYFPNTQRSRYWSSSPYADDTGDGAWYVGFGYGDVSGYYKHVSNYVRLVRGSQ